MAEFILKALVRAKGLESQYYIESAAVSTEEIGNPIYPMALRTLESHGIKGAKHAARQVSPADYNRFDYLIIMDRENLLGLRRILPNDPEGKISMLLDHTDPADKAHHHRDVADPWYTRNFDAAWEDITIGCQALLNELIPLLS